MWTNQHGQIFVIPRHRRRRILKDLSATGFRSLVDRLDRGNWRAAIERALGHVFGRSRSSGSLCNSDGRSFPMFTSHADETSYSFVAVPLGNNRFSVVSIKTTEAPEADRFDSRYTSENLRAMDEHLRRMIRDPTAQENWRTIILDNQGQSDADGNKKRPKGQKRATPVDRAYLTRGPDGTLQRVNVELDGDAAQFRKHIRERTAADSKAHSYFVLQEHLTGQFLGGVYWNPRRNGGRGGLGHIPADQLFTRRGANRLGFLPRPAVPPGAVKDRGYRKPDTGTAGTTRKNFRQRAGKILPGRKIAPPSRRRARESEWMEMETESENQILTTLNHALRELELRPSADATELEVAGVPAPCTCQECSCSVSTNHTG